MPSPDATQNISFQIKEILLFYCHIKHQRNSQDEQETSPSRETISFQSFETQSFGSYIILSQMIFDTHSFVDNDHKRNTKVLTFKGPFHKFVIKFQIRPYNISRMNRYGKKRPLQP